MKITIPKRIDADELWSDVFGSGWETYEWWYGHRYEDGADWDKAGVAVITSASEDGEGQYITPITIDDLVLAYTRLSQSDYTHCGGFTLDAPDACTGDAILQLCIYGELVFG